MGVGLQFEKIAQGCLMIAINKHFCYLEIHLYQKKKFALNLKK